MSPINRGQRLRRVLILLCHFTRNTAYYRAGWKNKALIRSQDFWKGINGNCLDIAVLEWCKLFGDKRDKHCWNNVIDPASEFENDLHALVSGKDFWDAYVKQFRTYRDRYIAHWDNDMTAHIPNLDDAVSVSRHYYKYVAEEAIQSGVIGGLPQDIEKFYEKWFSEAKAIYKDET